MRRWQVHDSPYYHILVGGNISHAADSPIQLCNFCWDWWINKIAGDWQNDWLSEGNLAQNDRRQMVDHFSMPRVARQFIRKHVFGSIISTLTSDVPWPLRGACDTRRTGSPEVLIETSNNSMSRDILFPSAPSKMSLVTIYVASWLNSHSSPPSRLTFHFIRCFFVKIQTGLSWLPPMAVILKLRSWEVPVASYVSTTGTSRRRQLTWNEASFGWSFVPQRFLSWSHWWARLRLVMAGSYRLPTVLNFRRSHPFSAPPSYSGIISFYRIVVSIYSNCGDIIYSYFFHPFWPGSLLFLSLILFIYL